MTIPPESGGPKAPLLFTWLIEDRRNATIWHVFGEADMGNADTLESGLALVIKPGRPVVVDLSGLEYIDSLGLHTFARYLERAKNVDSELIFAGPTPSLSRLLGTVGLSRLVRVFPDVESALQALERW